MGTGAIIGATIAATGSAYGAYKQNEYRNEAEEEQKRLIAEQEEEQKRIFEATKPQELNATAQFGVNSGEMGTYNDFLAEKPQSRTTTKNNTLSGSLGFGTLAL